MQEAHDQRAVYERHRTNKQAQAGVHNVMGAIVGDEKAGDIYLHVYSMEAILTYKLVLISNICTHATLVHHWGITGLLH